MITEKVFSDEWLQEFRKQQKYKRINPPIFEKMVHALLLLEKLTETDLTFIFKGGTSLVLLLDEADRFSVDIDILTSNTKEEIDKALEYVIENSRFTKYEYDERRSTSSNIPKAHYKIYYEGKDKNNTHIILDVLFEENYYPNLQETSINCSWVDTEEPLAVVTTPCTNSILGDKLTAFAPNTTGIPYKRQKSIEIIKQLHDVSNLIDKMTDISVVSETFKSIADAQIKYRELDISSDEVCDDILNTAYLIARRDNNIGEDKEKMTEIKNGLNGFGSYLMYGRFIIDDAVIASAKAALLAVKIKYNNLEPIELYESQDVTKLEIKNTDYNFLNRLRKTSKPAFYYWWKILQILGIE